jgi:K+-sensing histidine kinase KdpD
MIAGVAHDLSQQRQHQDAIQTAYDELQVVHQQLADLNTQLEARVDERTRTLSEAYLRLEEQHRALQELDSLKTDFVSMVSHELRTPLNNLGGGVELLMSRQVGSLADRNTLDLMQAEIRRLTRFVVNILNLSALDAGRLYLHPAPLSLAAVIREFMQNQLQGPGSDRIDVRVPADLPPVLADQAALESVLHHLVDNAMKYAVEGPILVEAIRETGRVKVQVTDCGPGVPADKRHLLFQKFQRLAASDNQSVYGYGLGLYLSHRLLEAMESTLDYETPAERGARFFFYLRVSL